MASGNSQMARVAEKWKTFLVNLGAKLSLYEIQKVRENYNVADLEYWGTSGKAQGIEITRDTFELFLNKTARYNLPEYASIRNITITESQLQELNHMLSLTLKPEVTKSCPIPNELLLKGDYIKFSDFINIDGNLNLNEGCKNITDINVFALNTVFVDRDVMLNGTKINLSIISPKWEIISTRKIELSGTEGNSKKIAGEPGLPGKAGGNFLGIGGKFVNGKNFTIISNGGKGGAGVDGEDGENGKNGYLDLHIDEESPCGPLTCAFGTYEDSNKNEWPCHQELYDKGYDPSSNSNLVDCRIRIFGVKGTEGRNGTDGGKGGKGGNPGSIVLLEFNDDSGISRYNNRGENGVDGRGGRGGETGVDGDEVLLVYKERRGLKDLNRKTISHKNDSRRRGQNGIDGGNEEGLQSPEKADSLEAANVLRRYKSYLRDNLNDRFKHDHLKEFLRQLDNNDNVESNYDTLELFNELKELEQQFYNFNNDADLIDLYKSLLNRISEYAQNPKDNEKSNQYKEALIYMYTAILGKISFLEDQSQSNLIINIVGYLDLIKKDIESMRNLEVAINKAQLINDYTANFKRDIDVQMDEAKTVIEQQIIPKINEISVRIDKKIASLISETREMAKKNNDEKVVLIDEEERNQEIVESKKRRLNDERDELSETSVKLADGKKRALISKTEQLAETIMLKVLFDELKVIGEVVSCIGPIGSAANSVLGWVSGQVKSSIEDDRKDEQKRLKSEIDSYANKIEKIQDKQVKDLNKLLKVISEKIAADPEKFKDLAAKIDDMRNRLGMDKKGNFSQVERIEVELKNALALKKKQLSGSMENNERTASAMTIMKKINQAVEMYTVGFDIYDKFKTDEANLNAISAAIARKNETIEQLQQNDKNIYNITVPMITKMKDTFHGVVSEMDTKSGIALDVTKWQVQSVLKEIQLLLKKQARMFPDAQDDLLTCTELLEGAMTTLINIYDRIQNYQREEKFIKFSGDMSLSSESDLQITDSRLSEAIDLNVLEKLIRSNYVIKKSKVAIEAFKNFVFPMAYVYFKDWELPSHLQPKNTFEGLLSKATMQIDYLKSKTEDYKTSMKGSGAQMYMKKGPFTSVHSALDPFFVWKNRDNKALIENLLSGQKVTLRADVMDSPLFRDAIKFSVAMFDFKAPNKTMQTEMNNVLENFEIMAWHLGDSHYRCDHKYYRIKSEVTAVSYYLIKDKNGRPMISSEIYRTLEDNDLILSPYATWEVLLMPTTNRVTVRDLQKYKDDVDLELMGEGSFIDNRIFNYTKLPVGKYYQGIEMTNLLDGHPKSDTIEGGDLASNRRSVRSIDMPKDDPIDPSLESPSLINKLGNYWSETLSMLKYPAAVNKIGGWFGEGANERHKETDLPTDGNDLFDINRNIASSNLPGGSKVQHLSNGFIDSENHSPGSVNYDSLDKHGNLLLLDLVLRKKNFTKYRNEDNAIKNDLDAEHAQNLAYSAYAP